MAQCSAILGLQCMLVRDVSILSSQRGACVEKRRGCCNASHSGVLLRCFRSVPAAIWCCIPFRTLPAEPHPDQPQKQCCSLETVRAQTPCSTLAMPPKQSVSLISPLSILIRTQSCKYNNKATSRLNHSFSGAAVFLSRSFPSLCHFPCHVPLSPVCDHVRISSVHCRFKAAGKCAALASSCRRCW